MNDDLMQPIQGVAMAQGEALALRIPVTTSAGQPVSLTGAPITWSLTTELGGGAALLTKTTAAGGVTLATTTAANDTAVVALAPADTAALSGTYYWEAAITGPQAARLARGYLVVEESAIL